MTELARVQPTRQLQPVDFVTPGFRGLNTVQSGSLMDPGYCTQAQNCVIDTSARLAARQGVSPLNFYYTLTFAAAPTGTTATLSAVWPQATGNYLTTFSDGEVRIASYTLNSTTVTWSVALTGTPTTSFSVSGAYGVTVTFTAAPSGQTGTLTTNWVYPTGQYNLIFNDGEQRTATFTYGSTAVVWTVALTGTPGTVGIIPLSVQSIFTYNQGGGNYTTLFSYPNYLTSAPQALGFSSGSGISNYTTPQNTGRIWFQNFNNKCIAFCSGVGLGVYNGTGTLNLISASAGTVPTGGIGCAAFGRVWCVASDLQTIYYSGLLDETDWSTTDGNAGIIDMHTIWSDGTDQVTAIFAFNASLVVCGTKHIVFFTDGRGSMLGLDPTQAYVFDMLVGTGCISQFTVDHIGETDVVFLSPNGVQSLLRLTQNRNNPIETLSKYNRDTLLEYIQAETPINISGCFNNLTGFYVLGLPTSGYTYCFDMRRLYNDDVGALCSITTLWTMALTACESGPTQILYLARANQGTAGVYSGYVDEQTSYTFSYTSPWLNLGQDIAQHLKMLKRMSLILYTAGNTTFTASWAADFGTGGGTYESGSTTQAVSNYGTLSQYGIAQYGIGQYGGGTNLYTWRYASRIKGQYMQIGLTCSVSGVFALQQMQLAAKIGRVA